MKTVEINIYKFNELPEDVQEKVLEKQYDINVSHEWWDFTYEDAANVGIKITGFDIDRASYCTGDFIDSAEECAEKITKEHGEGCETWKTATNYLKDRSRLVSKHSDGVNTDIVIEDNEYDFDNECDELDSEFLKSILEDYRIILSKEYEYLTSEEAIKETIEANDYDFTVDGEIY